MPFRYIAKQIDIKAGKSAKFEIGQISIAIFNVDGTYYAVDEICPHKGGPLLDGLVDQLTVKCPWHGAVFLLLTGAGISGPCANGVRRYEVRVNDGNLEIDIDNE
jgi:nitrite reductase/ring-hydroxylating ferredoxin subunit